MCSATDELCFFDPRCSDPPTDASYGHLGCNAGGVGTNCRYCGFGAYRGIECPSRERAGNAPPTELIYTATVAGTVNSFNQSAYRLGLVALLNSNLTATQIVPGDISLTVESASVLVTATIRVPSKTVVGTALRVDALAASIITASKSGTC